MEFRTRRARGEEAVHRERERGSEGWKSFGYSEVKHPDTS